MHGCNLAYIDYHERIVRLLTLWVNVKKKNKSRTYFDFLLCCLGIVEQQNKRWTEKNHFTQWLQKKITPAAPADLEEVSTLSSGKPCLEFLIQIP